MNFITHVINSWSNFHHQQRISARKNGERCKEEKNPKPLTLFDLFDDPVKFKLVMDILIEKKFISPLYIWADRKSGYKAYIVVLIKYLHSLGYYKGNLMPGYDQIIEISKNTFGTDICISHVKHKSYNSILIDYIPPANEIISKTHRNVC